jgi:hypothetical protein
MVYSELVDVTNSHVDYFQVKCPTCGAGTNQACVEVFEDPDGIGESEISWGKVIGKVHKSRLDKAEKQNK